MVERERFLLVPTLRVESKTCLGLHALRGAWEREKGDGVGVHSFSFGNAVSP